MNKKFLQHLFITLGSLVCIILIFSRKDQPEHTSPRDYDQIAEEGVLRAVTEYNGISYHADKDSIAGFDYELLQEFARAHHLKLEVTPEMDLGKRIHGVLTGKYDIVASGMAVNTDGRDSLLFTGPIVYSKLVLVQRVKQSDSDSLFINRVIQLANKKVAVVKNSPAVLRLHHLMDEIADTIYIEEIDNYGPEQLMAMVSSGDIDFAACDLMTARKAITNFKNLNIDRALGFTQLYAWAVSPSSPALLDSLNTWLTSFSKGKKYKQIEQKYFVTKTY